MKTSVGGGKICFLGSITHILGMYNIRITEEYLLGLSTALQFRFGYMSGARIHGLLPSITCSDFSMDINMINDTLSLYNVKMVCTTEKRQADYVDTLKTYLKNNIPVMILIDVFNLPYYHEEKKHAARYITCCKWRESEKKIEIVDTAYDTLHNRCFQGSIDEEVIFANDMSNLVIGHVYCMWHVIHLANMSIKEGWDTKKTFVKIPLMIHQKCYKVLFGDVISQYKVGYLGIQYLQEELLRCATSTQTPSGNDRFIQSLFEQMNSYTGPVVTRTLFYRFLVMVGSGKDIETLLASANALRDKWENIGFLLMKSTYSENSKKLIGVCEQFNCVMEMESAMQSLIKNRSPINVVGVN